MPDLKKALIIETAFIGDAILSLALAEEIKQHFPSAQVSLLVRPESASLLSYSPSVYKVFSYDKYGIEKGIVSIRRKAEELNKEEFDTIFAIHESKRTAALLGYLRAERKIGFSTAKNLKDVLTISVPPAFEPPKTKKILSLLAPFPIEIEFGTLPKLDIPISLLPPDISAASVITIAPGSAWKTKEWPWQYYAELAKKFTSRGKAVALIGGETDKNVAAMIESRVCSHLLKNYAGKLSLPEAAAIISHSELLVSNDSSPIHIATATGTRSVVLFGPTIPAFGFAPPPSLGREAEREGLWCRPCTSHGSRECPIHTHECMRDILPETVYDISNSILASA